MAYAVEANPTFSVILLPLSLYPFVGTFVAAAFKAIGTAQHLHKPVSSSHLSLITAPTYGVVPHAVL